MHILSLSDFIILHHDPGIQILILYKIQCKNLFLTNDFNTIIFNTHYIIWNDQ